MDCPRCQSRLQRSRDEEAAGDCLNCGPIYIPTVSDPQAEVRAEAFAGNTGKRQRARGAKTPTGFAKIKQGHGRVAGDGCDVSPSCLTCPLPECKYVDQESQPQERTEPVNSESREPAHRILSTSELGAQCIESLRALQRIHTQATERLEQIRDEARKLVRIAELTETTVPPELAALAGPPPKTPKKLTQWKCPAPGCSFEGLGRSIQKHQAAYPDHRAA